LKLWQAKGVSCFTGSKCSNRYGGSVHDVYEVFGRSVAQRGVCEVDAALQDSVPGKYNAQRVAPISFVPFRSR